MDSGLISKYAVLNRKTKLRVHQSPEVIVENDGGGAGAGDHEGGGKHCDEITLEAGSLIKVFQTKTSPTSTMGGSSFKHSSTVQILDLVNHLAIYENLYECPQANLTRVDESIWPFIISIVDPEQRLRLVQDTNHCKWLVYLKINDLVSVSGEMFRMPNQRFDCIIRHIGPVHELHPVGYFFGLELLHLDSGYSPQSDKVPFAETYMQCDPTLAIFTTANWIRAIPKEIQKKFSAREFLTETFEKVRSAIGPSSALTGSGGSSGSNTSSLKREKKVKKPKEATAQFYDIGGPVTVQSTNNVKEMDRKNKEMANAAAALTAAEQEEFKQQIENYEKSLERRAATTATTTNTVQTQTQPQSGILKNKRKTEQTKLPPPSVLNVDGREIVVIDNAEATEAADVIVVNKCGQDVDLIELLGGDWPKTAGDAAVILNNPKNQTNSTTTSSSSTTTITRSDHQIQQLSSSAAGGGSGSVVGSNNNNNNASNNTGGSGTLNKNNRNKSVNPMSHLGGSSSGGGKKTNDLSNANNKMNDNKKIQKISHKNVKQDQPQYTNYNNNSEIDKRQQLQQPLYANTTSSSLSTIDIDSNYDPPELLPAVLDNDFMQTSPLQEVPETGLGVGSMVEVNVPESSEHLYGVIRWIGIPPGVKSIMIGVELEDDHIDKQLLATDGGFNGISLFKCPMGRGLFITTDQCSIDRRFLGAEGGIGNDTSAVNDNRTTKTTNGFHDDQQTFGHMECPVVPGAVAPIKCLSLNDLEELCGKFKGIQGHHNSCYLDVTLFSMFAFTPVFDAVLYRPPEKDDISHYTEVQTVLREEIVNPLRKHMFVRADRVMKLRQLLDKLSSVSGLTSEEKDPEEFLNCLLSQIMKADPFLKLNSGQDAYYYQLFVEKDERLSFPSVQQLFEQSFYTSDIKLKEVPSCLIIQMPRFGKNYKMYPRILPSQVLDVTDIIDDSPRQCSVCGKLAEFECRDCFGVLQGGVGLESTSFCEKCLETVHMHAKRSNHTHRKLSVPQDFRVMAEHMTVPRLYMELFAVVCIETSHYVTFVKAGSGPDAPWCFFDSMADRKGEQNGYNIPEMITVPDLPQWLSEEGARTVNETSSNDKMLPEHAKRLFCDAYMCMYQSTDVMMYR